MIGKRHYSAGPDNHPICGVTASKRNWRFNYDPILRITSNEARVSCGSCRLILRRRAVKARRKAVAK